MSHGERKEREQGQFSDHYSVYLSVYYDKNTWGKKSEVRHSSNSQEKKGECSDKKTIVLDALGETIQRNTTKEVPSSVYGALKYMIIVTNMGLKW